MGLKSVEGRIAGHGFIAYLRHLLRTLFTAHASRTHIKAHQTGLHAKPDNSSGLTYDSPSEGLLRKKETFQHKKHQKSMEDSSEMTTQAKHRPTLLHASFRSRIETKARRAASRPRRHPPQCLSHGRSFGSIRSDPWLHSAVPKPSRLSFNRSRLPIPLGWGWLASGPRYGSQRGAVLL